ncbi:hypothetical protein OY671_009199, partial [Metschnikowia pulcherrima]
DSGSLHASSRLEKLDDILSHPVAGTSWEGMVIENIIGAVGDRYDAHFYRTANGAEIDLILVSGGVPEVAIEVKRSTAPSVERGFHLACDDLEIEKRWSIYPGEMAYPKPHGITAMPSVQASEQSLKLSVHTSILRSSQKIAAIGRPRSTFSRAMIL